MIQVSYCCFIFQLLTSPVGKQRLVKTFSLCQAACPTCLSQICWCSLLPDFSSPAVGIYYSHVAFDFSFLLCMKISSYVFKALLKKKKIIKVFDSSARLVYTTEEVNVFFCGVEQHIQFKVHSLTADLHVEKILGCNSNRKPAGSLLYMR